MNVAYHDACCHDAFESQAAKADQREPLQRAPFELRPKILKAGKVSNMLSCLWCQFDLLLWRHENFVFFFVDIACIDCDERCWDHSL